MAIDEHTLQWCCSSKKESHTITAVSALLQWCGSQGHSPNGPKVQVERSAGMAILLPDSEHTRIIGVLNATTTRL